MFWSKKQPSKETVLPPKPKCEVYKVTLTTDDGETEETVFIDQYYWTGTRWQIYEHAYGNGYDLIQRSLTQDAIVRKNRQGVFRKVTFITGVLEEVT